MERVVQTSGQVNVIAGEIDLFGQVSRSRRDGRLGPTWLVKLVGGQRVRKF